MARRLSVVASALRAWPDRCAPDAVFGSLEARSSETRRLRALEEAVAPVGVARVAAVAALERVVAPNTVGTLEQVCACAAEQLIGTRSADERVVAPEPAE